VRRLIAYLTRWTTPWDGPLIASVSPFDGFAYLAIRLRFFHWGAWIRVIMRPANRFPRFDANAFDYRGYPCKCGSGIRIQQDVDGCGTEGCLTRMLERAITR